MDKDKGRNRKGKLTNKIGIEDVELVTPKEIGSNLRFYRVTSNMTQSYVAEKMLIDRSTISCYESGKVTPTIYNLILFSKLYECKLEDLVTKGEKKRAGIRKYNYNEVTRIDLAV